MPPKKKKVKLQHHHPNHRQHSTTKPDLSHEEMWDDKMLVRSWNDAVREYEHYHSLAVRMNGGELERVLDDAEEAERNGGEIDLGFHGVEGKGEGADGEGEGEEDEVEEGEVEDGEPEVEGLEVEEGEAEDDGELEEEEEHEERQITNPNPSKHVKVNGVSRAHGREHGPVLPPPQVSSPSSQLLSRSRLHSTPQSQSHSSRHQSQPSASAVPAHPQRPDPTTNADQTLDALKMAYYWAGYYSGLYDGQRQR